MTSGSPFDGDWVVTAYRSGEELVAPEEASEALLSIAEGQVSGTMGINRLIGGWEHGTIAAPLATTRMAGPPELMEQERILLGHLEEFDAVEMLDDGMTLHRDGLVLVELERKGTAERFLSS